MPPESDLLLKGRILEAFFYACNDRAKRETRGGRFVSLHCKSRRIGKYVQNFYC